MLKKKKNFGDDNRPSPNEFGLSRYMERDGKIYMIDSDGKVYRLSSWFWDNPERELLSLRTQELRQKRKYNANRQK